MAGFPATAWIWWSAGVVVGLLAIWLLYRSLLHDRSRGRRRCPKCWYDMSGTGSLTCSECGATYTRERKLFKTRRRWRWAMVSLVLSLASAAGMLAPKVQRDGWVGSMPTTALILAAPWCDPDHSSLEEQIVAVLLGRTGRLWDWQERCLLRTSFDRINDLQHDLNFRYIVWAALESGVVTVDLQLHDRWPVGWPLYCTYKTESPFLWDSMIELRPVKCVTDNGARIPCYELARYIPSHHQLSDAVVQMDVGSLRQTQQLTIEFDVLQMTGSSGEGWTRIGSCSTSFAIDFVGELDDYLTPIVSELSNESVQNCSSWSIATADGEQFNVHLDFPRDCSDELPMYITQRVALMHRDRVVASEGAVMARDFINPHFSIINMTLIESALAPIREDDLEWALRLTGDPSWALREGWSRYWAGVVEFPIRWVHDGEEWVARSASDDSSGG